MKLSDNMTMDACNAWRGPAPRKCRPPKIGDIPKHSAVDEESPDSTDPISQEALLDSSGNTEERLDEKKSVLCIAEKNVLRSPERGVLKPIRTPSPEHPRTLLETDDPENRITIQLSSTDEGATLKSGPEEAAESPSSEETGEREFLEARKDSALFLEEAEGLPRLRELVKARAPKFVRPRRESSGYGSNLGTFDEDRRNSSTADSLQDLSAFLKERRRSSTKRRNSRIGLALQDCLSEGVANCCLERMPTTEHFRKISSAGLEMPNIEEVKEVLREDLSPQQEDPDRLCSFAEQIAAGELSQNPAPTHSTKEQQDPFNLATLAEAISDPVPTHSEKNSNIHIIEHQYSAAYPTDDNDAETAASSTANLPAPSVKMYQLLSTQSEDAGDGITRFPDRRISLQISRQDDRASGEQKVESAEGSAGAPLRKLSSPGDVGASQLFLGDVAKVTVRPIYPDIPYSPYGSPQGSPRNRRRPLRESRRVSIDTREGTHQLNQYKLLDNIGQGSYGIVKLVHNAEDNSNYAMKILSKKKLMKKAGIFGRMAPGRKGPANPLAKVYREIALLKKLDHPNVVKLVEVLDDPDEDNLYLVFELVQCGEILQVPTDNPLDEETARKNFRDIVMGVEYLHYQRIVHRDIKPSNLLVDSDGRVKIADLGVSAELRASGELLSGSAGTPAFAAPETTTLGASYSGTLCDIWSMGVTLYTMVTGRIPWDGAGSRIALQEAIRTEALRFPEKPVLTSAVRDLITRMLEKEWSRRITLPEIKAHRWLTKYGAEALPSEADNCRLPVTVTDEEVERVVTRVPKLDTLILIKTMLKQHSFQNPFQPKKSGRPTGSGVSGEDLAGRSAGPIRDTVRSCKSERFQRSGRSNSAPDSYNWQTNGRQISVDSPLPPVTEASYQEAELEKRRCEG